MKDTHKYQHRIQEDGFPVMLRLLLEKLCATCRLYCRSCPDTVCWCSFPFISTWLQHVISEFWLLLHVCFCSVGLFFP